MNRFYIVKEYIYYYMYRRKLTKEEFCKICEIDCDKFYEIEKNCEKFDMYVLEKISKYIHVPINKLYIDLDDSAFHTFIEEYPNCFKQ